MSKKILLVSILAIFMLLTIPYTTAVNTNDNDVVEIRVAIYTDEEETDPETGKKIKIAKLPDGTILKFWTEEELTEI